MRTIFFMMISLWSTWLPASILLPWVGKCLAELVLLRASLAHGVRYLWATALYTFSTTLMLMIMAEAKYAHYRIVDGAVSIGGGATMLLTLIALVNLLRKGKREYGGIALTFVLLCASQVVIMLSRGKMHYTTNNWLHFASWIGFTLWLAWECHYMPKGKMDIMSVAAAMARDLAG